MKTFLTWNLRALAVCAAMAALGQSAFAGGSAPDCGGSPRPSVPEVDPGAAAGAMTLLVGGALSLAERRRSK